MGQNSYSSIPLSFDGRGSFAAPLFPFEIFKLCSARIILGCSDQLLVGQAPSDNLFHDCGEPLRVREFPLVESKRLLIAVCLKVEWFDADIRPPNVPLQET